MTAGLIAAYALSPIDLIPDFIPVIGYLDDLIVVPLGIKAAVAMIPPELMAQFREEASSQATRPRSYVGTVAIAAVWVMATGLMSWRLWLR